MIHNNKEISNLTGIPISSTDLSIKFSQFLENTGIKFSHRNREYVSLNDLFVFPDLQVINESVENNLNNTSSENIWNYSSRILISGDEQSGKTTLAKRLFLDAISRGLLPILVNGEDIKDSRFEKEIPKIFSKTYASIFPNNFFEQNNLVCIVDDLSKCTLNKKAINNLIKSINSIFSNSIFIAEESFRLIVPDFSELDEYQKLEILPFGNVRRAELIEKWVSLGLTEEAEDQRFYEKIDDLSLHVNSLVRKNVVPSKPIYILMLLQSFETITPQRLELTSYGHCYQNLSNCSVLN